MLSDKEIRLLRILLDAADPISARALAAQLGVSLRTAKTYVQQINAEQPGSIVSSHAGYRAEPSRAQALLDREAAPGGVPQTSDERVVFLLQRLLANEAPLNVFDLCEELYVSLSTLRADLGRVRRRIAPFKLQLVQERNALTLDGLEKDKRKLAGDLLYREASASFLSLETIQHAFPDIDAVFIGSCVRDTLDEFHHFANDYSAVNLVLHIAITIDRLRSGHALREDAPPPLRPISSRRATASWPAPSSPSSSPTSASRSPRLRPMSSPCSSPRVPRCSTTAPPRATTSCSSWALTAWRLCRGSSPS